MSQKEGVDALVMEYLISRGYTKTVAELQAETGASVNASAQDVKPVRNLTKQLLSNISEDVYVLGLKDKDTGVYAREYDSFRSWAVDSIDIVKPQLLSLCFPIFVHCYAGMIRLGLTEEAQRFMTDYKQDYMEYYTEEMQSLSALTSSEQYKSDEFISNNTFMSCMLTAKFSVRLSSLAYNLLTLFLVQSDSVLIASIINNKLAFKKLEDASVQGQMQRSGQEQLLVELPGYTAGSKPSASDFVPIPLGVPGTVPKIQRLLGTNTTAATLAAANISLPVSKDDGLYRDLINKIVRPRAVLSSLNKRRRQATAGLGENNNSGGEFTAMDSILDNAAKLGAFSIEAAVEVSDLTAAGSAEGEADAGNKEGRGRDKKDKPLARGAALEPSIIFATVTNAYEGMTCLHMTPTLTQMASGHRDSSVRVWRLNPEEDMHFGKYLRHSSGGGEWTMSEALPKTKRMMQEAAIKKANGGAYSGNRTAADRNSKSPEGKMAMLELRGHSRAVYGVSQDCSRGGDDRLILSCSADESIRLWDTAVSQCVGKYSCVSPPWDVSFSPVGYHFASANQDKTATVFATDRVTPLRLLTGHVSDVTTVSWHGNATLLATGSDDKTARLWDVRTSHSVRLLRGCMTPVSCTAISPLGNLMAAGTDNGKIYIWDLSTARQLAVLQGHEGAVHSVAFSTDSAALTSGGADCSVRVWDMQEVVKTQVKLSAYNTAATARASASSSKVEVLDAPQLVLRPQNSYFTKFSPVFHVGYTVQNLLYAGGPFSLAAATASRDNKGENAAISSTSLSEQDTISALGISHAVQASH